MPRLSRAGVPAASVSANRWLGSIWPAPPFGRNGLEWSEVEPFFRENGCVVAGDPELAWYREAWGALEEAGLAGAVEYAELGLDRMMPRLRAVCLLAMYLGIYQAAGEDSELGGYFSQHAPCSRYLDLLGADVRELREFAGLTGIVETDAEAQWEDDDLEMGLLYELAIELVGEERHGIFDALVEGFGGERGLFAALWNSRKPPHESESRDVILAAARPGDGKLEVMSYVENGMAEWQLY